MRSLRNPAIRILRTIVQSNAETPGELRSAIANHMPSEDLAIVLGMTLATLAASITVNDVIELLESVEEGG